MKNIFIIELKYDGLRKNRRWTLLHYKGGRIGDFTFFGMIKWLLKYKDSYGFNNRDC